MEQVLPIQEMNIWGGIPQLSYGTLLAAQQNPNEERVRRQKMGWIFVMMAIIILSLVGYLLYQKGVFKIK